MSKKPTFTTAIEWHDAKTDPPKESMWCLAVTPGSSIQKVEYSKVWHKFNACDYREPIHAYDVAFWAEIPEQFTWDALAPYREGDGA